MLKIIVGFFFKSFSHFWSSLVITLFLFPRPPFSLSLKNFYDFFHHGIVDARNLKLQTGKHSTKSAYRNFNMTIHRHIKAVPSLTVQFAGYSSNFNEEHSRSSGNLAPHRTKSSRPIRYYKLLENITYIILHQIYNIISYYIMLHHLYYIMSYYVILFYKM